MNKKTILIGALALMSMGATAQEVKVFDNGRKWSQSFDALLKGNTVKRISARGTQTLTADSLVRLSITTAPNMADEVANFVTNEGYQAETATDLHSRSLYSYAG